LGRPCKPDDLEGRPSAGPPVALCSNGDLGRLRQGNADDVRGCGPGFFTARTREPRRHQPLNGRGWNRCCRLRGRHAPSAVVDPGGGRAVARARRVKENAVENTLRADESLRLTGDAPIRGARSGGGKKKNPRLFLPSAMCQSHQAPWGASCACPRARRSAGSDRPDCWGSQGPGRRPASGQCVTRSTRLGQFPTIPECGRGTRGRHRLSER